MILPHKMSKIVSLSLEQEDMFAFFLMASNLPNQSI